MINDAVLNIRIQFPNFTLIRADVRNCRMRFNSIDNIDVNLCSISCLKIVEFIEMISVFRTRITSADKKNRFSISKQITDVYGIIGECVEFKIRNGITFVKSWNFELISRI